MADVVAAARAVMPPPESTRIVLRPAPVGGRDDSFDVRRRGDAYVVQGAITDRCTT